MLLKEVVKSLNQEHIDNNFKLSLLAAKRSIPKDGRDWAIVKFENHVDIWRGFTQCRVELYEAIPEGWPVSDVAERLGCSVRELEIVAKYNHLTNAE